MLGWSTVDDFMGIRLLHVVFHFFVCPQQCVLVNVEFPPRASFYIFVVEAEWICEAGPSPGSLINGLCLIKIPARYFYLPFHCVFISAGCSRCVYLFFCVFSGLFLLTFFFAMIPFSIDVYLLVDHAYFLCISAQRGWVYVFCLHSEAMGLFFVFKIRFLLRLNKQSMALRRHFFLYPLNASKITMQDGELEWRQKRVFLLFNVYFFPMMELPFQSCSTSWHELCMTCFSMHFTDVIVSSLQMISSTGWPLGPFRILNIPRFYPCKRIPCRKKTCPRFAVFSTQ